MSYTIHIDYSDFCARDEIVNLTKEALEEDKKLALEVLEVDSEDEELLFETIEEATWPIVNYMHILQHRPDEEDVKELAKLTLTPVIVYVPELEVCGIMLTGAGYDMSAHIELAYRMLDGDSPIQADFLEFLPKEGKEKLLELREKQKKC